MDFLLASWLDKDTTMIVVGYCVQEESWNGRSVICASCPLFRGELLRQDWLRFDFHAWCSHRNETLAATNECYIFS